jgi:hypothetical protein
MSSIPSNAYKNNKTSCDIGEHDFHSTATKLASAFLGRTTQWLLGGVKRHGKYTLLALHVNEPRRRLNTQMKKWQFVGLGAA